MAFAFSLMDVNRSKSLKIRADFVSGGAPASWVKEQIVAAKKETDKPFGVNLMLMNPEADEIAKIIAEEKVKVVTTGAGNPAKYMDMWKEAGVIVIPVVASVALAKLMERGGASAVIAEGMESGGHIGAQTTMTLVPQVVDAVSRGSPDGYTLCHRKRIDST